jgi:hypothetical protein
LLLVAQGLATNYFHPSTDTSKKTTREEGISHIKFSYPPFSKYFYIGITLKHNKLIFLFLFVIIFIYLQLLSNVSQDLQAMKPPPILFTDEHSTKFLHAI